jgi:UPF0716 protein FxsA
MWFFALFLIVPLIEIALFIQVGGLIGLFPTLAFVVFTAITGSMLIRRQGVREMANLRSSFENLNDPTEPLAHGAMILFSGALLITPGFFTDAVGFTLLIPPVRNALFKWAKSRAHVTHFQMGPDPSAEPQRRYPDDTVIDGEFENLGDTKKPTHEPSGWTRH